MVKFEEKWILCLGGSKSKVTLINSIKKNGFKCCIIDKNKKSFSKNLADLFVNQSIINTNQIYDILEKIGIQNKIVLIFAYVSLMEGQFTASKISQMLNIPYCSKDILKLSWNKVELKKKCKNLGIPTPDYVINENDKLKKFLVQTKKIISKPKIGGIGSNSVFMFDSLNISKISNEENVFFEEYLGDELYSYQALKINGKFVFEFVLRKYIRHNSFTIDGFSANVPNEYIKNIIHLARKFIDNTKIDNSFIGFDVVCKNNIFYFIDFGILLDAKIDQFLSFQKINVFDLFLNSLFSKSTRKKYTLNKNSSIVFLYPKTKGRIKKLPNVKTYENSMTKLEFDKGLNDYCTLSNVVSDTIGHIISSRLVWDDLKNFSNKIENQIILE